MRLRNSGWLALEDNLEVQRSWKSLVVTFETFILRAMEGQWKVMNRWVRPTVNILERQLWVQSVNGSEGGKIGNYIRVCFCNLQKRKKVQNYSSAAVKNYLSDLKPRECMILHFWRPGVQNMSPRAIIKLSAGLCSFLETWEKNLFPCLN